MAERRSWFKKKKAVEDADPVPDVEEEVIEDVVEDVEDIEVSEDVSDVESASEDAETDKDGEYEESDDTEDAQESVSEDVVEDVEDIEVSEDVSDVESASEDEKQKAIVDELVTIYGDMAQEDDDATIVDLDKVAESVKDMAVDYKDPSDKKQKSSTLIDKLKSRTKEKPDVQEADDKPKKKDKYDDYDPDSFTARLHRWKLMTFDGYVVLRTLSRDDKRGEYILESTLVKWKDLPRDAVHCSGESKTYALDKIKGTRWYAENHIQAIRDYEDTQFNATDAALYMKSNKFDNALATHWNEYSHVDFKKIAIIIVAVLSVVLLILTR